MFRIFNQPKFAALQYMERLTTPSTMDLDGDMRKTLKTVLAAQILQNSCVILDCSIFRNATICRVFD